MRWINDYNKKKVVGERKLVVKEDDFVELAREIGIDVDEKIEQILGCGNSR